MQNDTRIEIARLDERLRGLDRLLEEREKQVRIAFVNAEKAVDKAEAAQRVVNSTQNEFRGAMSDANRLYMPRSECEQALATMKETIEKLETNISQRSNITAGVREGSEKSWGTIIAIIAAAANAIMFFYYVSHFSVR
jgi:chromosome segregation ATPase